MKNKTSIKPLKGIRIVSLALNLPGPAALMRCRALGATCIKIEPLAAGGGDPMKAYNPAAYVQMHLGVRTLALDLKSEKGQARLGLELDKADVLLTSFRPSALKRLGLDWQSLRKRHPQLWQVAIVGGEGDAAEVAGHDLTYLAEQGLVTGLDLPATLFADMTGSLLAVEAILCAALQKKMATKPQQIRVSLGAAAKYLAFPRSWGLTWSSGAVGGAHAGYQVYKCKDGRAAVAALEPHFAKNLCSLAGIATQGFAAMMQPKTKADLKRWFAKQTCAALDAWAEQHDLPIYTLKP
ncbi:MAG: hypothetical protein RLY95_636 [Pseudomonadota bacterium]|jgi:crotonobetainyl-CoA:carnitine CoA-transferase CaiB-like acyl-CoA transferase